MKWLLESDVFDDDLLPILDELKRQNVEYKVADHMTSIHPERVQALFPPDECVVFYGSLGMSRSGEPLHRNGSLRYENRSISVVSWCGPVDGADEINK